jgi:hypothetical protein
MTLKSLTEKLHHKKLGRSAAAMAGLAGALSVLFGVLAAYAAPHGLARLKVALHVARAPLIVKLAPVVTGIAVTLGAVAGVLSFYSWFVERQDPQQQEPTHSPHSE